MVAKSNSYYTPGNPKRERVITKDWYKRCWDKAFTQDEIIAKIRALDDKDFLLMMNSLQPKTNINENNGLVVRIMLDGITQKIPVQGRVIEQAALDAHTDPVLDDL